MKKTLLSLVAFVCYSMGVLAYSNGDAPLKWYYNSSTDSWSRTVESDSYITFSVENYHTSDPSLHDTQIIECSEAGLLAKWKDANPTEFESMKAGDRSYYKLTGAVKTDDISALKDVEKIEYFYVKSNSSITIDDLNSTILPQNAKEAICVDNTNFYSYSSTASSGTLENALTMDISWKSSSLTGTMKMEGTYYDVFGQMFEATGHTKTILPACQSIDLEYASFPSFSKEGQLIYNESNIYSTTDHVNYSLPLNQDGQAEYTNLDGNDITSYTGKLNGLVNLNVFDGSVTYLSLPTDDATEVLPSKSLFKCTKLTGVSTDNPSVFVVPCNIKNIGAYAMLGCSSVVNLEVDCVEHIGEVAFARMSSLTDANLPTNLKEVPAYCFTNCVSLKHISLPEGITDIEYFAFGATSGNTIQLESVHFPNTLRRIAADSFRENHKLPFVTFPHDVEYIGESAFFGCENLKDVYFTGTSTIPEVAAGAFDIKSLFNSGGVNVDTENIYDSSSKSFYRDYWGYAAILHYPVVAQEAEYAAVSCDDITNYIAAKESPVAIYTLENGVYVPYNGIPQSGETYYVQSSVANVTTSTTSSVSGVATYYTDQDGTQVGTPKVSGIFYYQKGMKDTYATVDMGKDAVGAVDQYYKLDENGKKVPTELHFWNPMWYPTDETETVNNYNKEFSQGGYLSDLLELNLSEYYLYNWENGEYYVGMPTFNTTLYYSDNGSYKETDHLVEGVTEYYVKNWDNTYSLKDNSQIQVNCDVYTKQTITQIKFESSTTYSSDHQWYTKSSDGNYTLVPTLSWYVHISESTTTLYYVNGSEPNIISADGTEYNPTVTYYTDANGTSQASTVTFDDTYYYFGASYTEADNDQLQNATLNATKLYTKNGEEYESVTGDLAEDCSVTYYTQTKAGSDDVYGQYYTDPARNALYTATMVDEDGNILMQYVPYFHDVFPDSYRSVMDQYEMGNRYKGDPQEGVKRFVLVEGYSANPEEEKIMSKEYDETWYTMCFPFDLSDEQLASAFNETFDIVHFTGAKLFDKDSEKPQLIFYFDEVAKAIYHDANGNVYERNEAEDGTVSYDPVEDTSLPSYDNSNQLTGYLAKAGYPYMIHPATGVQNNIPTKITAYFSNLNWYPKKKLNEAGEWENVSSDAEGATWDWLNDEEEIIHYSTKPVVEATTNEDGTVTTGETLGHYRFIGNCNNDGKLIPYGYYFLGVPEGGTYPKYYRETGAEDRTSGYWSQYSAIIYAADEGAQNIESSIHGTALNTANINRGIVETVSTDKIDSIVEEAKAKGQDVKYIDIIVNIKGQVVRRGTTNIEGLPKGLYIVNGKKYFVK